MICYAYDIAAAVILIAFIGRGFKRGVLRTVLSLICLIVSFTAAAACSSYPVTSKIYDDYFSGMIREHIDSAVKEVKHETSQKLRNEAEQSADKFIDEHLGGSEELKQLVRDYLDTDDDTLRSQISETLAFFHFDISTLLTNPYFRDKIDSIASEYSGSVTGEINSRLPFGIQVSQSAVEEFMTYDKAYEAIAYELLGIKSEGSDTLGAAEYIEKNAVRPTAVRMIGTVIWAVVFAVVNIVLKFIIGIILIIRKIEPVKACDSLMGGVLGAAVGASVIAAAVILIVLIVRFTGGMTYMNEEIFSDTLFFGKLYDFAKGFDFLK